jgi:chromosome segregation protein
MHITKLRLLGFKSFVEPTELVIEKGLTGVVGPNGCGKSNLLEALRWVMGETSYKSMRASSMEDVIFSGTTTRPGRNIAEVTMFVDNSARLAPAEFNDTDVLEITRRIERDMGSAYRVNSKETRARDIKILFEDAATGARSPALVRQGQIAEIVNAKPDQRRRILEDAAGVAGLHSRRHDAELRLKAAEANLARVSDVLGQLNTQVEALKRQARQARRYKEISAEIRKSEALLHHLGWCDAQAQVDAAEAGLRTALETVAAATQVESALQREELSAAEVLPTLRDAEAAKAAALHRLTVERDNFEREAERQAARQRELQLRAEQMTRDAAREEALVKEAAETHARLLREKSELERTEGTAKSFEARAMAAVDAADAAVKTIDQRLAGLQAAAAEARARRKTLEAQVHERREARQKIERQLATLEAQHRDVVGRAPDAARLSALQSEGQELMSAHDALDDALVDAEAHVLDTSAALSKARDGAQSTRLAAERLAVEVETLFKLLKPQGEAIFPPIVDSVTVEPGYETALGAALGEDLEAPVTANSPMHWRHTKAEAGDPALPKGVEPLAARVTGPPELARRLAQIGVVTAADGARLQTLLRPGQRLVSKIGDLWRWDGFVAAAHGESAAAVRLAQRNRLGGLAGELETLQSASSAQIATEVKAIAAHRAAEEHVRQQRQHARETQSRLAETRQTLTTLELQARETQQRLQSVGEARDAAREALEDTSERLVEVEMALETLSEADAFEEQLSICQEDAGEKRTAHANARADLATLDREHKARLARLADIGGEIARWTERKASAVAQTADLKARLDASLEELETFAELPEMLAEQREKLLTAVAVADAARQSHADALAAADQKFRTVQSELRSAQLAVSTARETRAGTEARLEAARNRRAEDGRKTRELLGVAPDECLALAEHPADTALPELGDVDRQLARLKADRERLGGVNLAADDDLVRMTEQFDGMDKERLDVEQAIAKLRAGIGELNREAKGRLDTAFHTVNGHFQKLFGILFNGGEARLELIESPDDPLDGGLEIIAKPPGKKPATLSLLSGGEQTLTALSLIFAVFLTNPSPICVLDEVDAPLDDANVDRFCLMMEQMAEDTATRFLVITHHPTTMSRMNRLFGVTMAEKGVSQLVSVDLELARKFIEAAA